jgi:hypothetical protein
LFGLSLWSSQPAESKNASLIEAAVSGLGEVGAAAAAVMAAPKLQPPKTPDGKSLVTESMFLRYWHQELAKHEPQARMFRMLKKPENNYLVRDDFRLIVQGAFGKCAVAAYFPSAEIVNRHPGLEFLESHPDFQLKYAQTVIARIFCKELLPAFGAICLLSS